MKKNLRKSLYILTGCMLWNMNIISAQWIKTSGPDFKLTAYPNPASDITKINYELANNTNVTFSLSDMYSSKRLLFNSMRSAGEHSYHLNTSGLSSGFYICSLVAGNNIQHIKICVVKD